MSIASILRRLAFTCAVGALCVAGFRTPASAYENVRVLNMSGVLARVTVSYSGCRSDFVAIAPNVSGGMSGFRGACLVTSIVAKLASGAPVTPFTSPGSSISSFQIRRAGAGFEIVRV